MISPCTGSVSRPFARLSLLSAVIPLMLALSAQTAVAQDAELPTAAKAEEKQPGLHPMLKAASTLALSDSRNMVGVEDGSTWNIGLIINGGLDYISPEGHIIINELKWQLTYTRTPIMDRFYKSLDSLDLGSAYLYRLPGARWTGPFAALRLKTSVFPGYAVRAEETEVIRLDEAGNTVLTQTIPAQGDIDLTEAFAPTSLRQSAGWFADFLDRSEIQLQFRAGVSLWETWVKSGYTVADDGDTPQLELKQMVDSVQFGPEARLTAKGVLAANINYQARAQTMYPLVISADTDLSGADLLNVEFEFTLGAKLTEWASLDYSLKALKEPLVVDEWQLSNALLVTLTAGLL